MAHGMFGPIAIECNGLMGGNRGSFAGGSTWTPVTSWYLLLTRPPSPQLKRPYTLLSPAQARTTVSAHCRLRNAHCRLRNAHCRLRNAHCGRQMLELRKGKQLLRTISTSAGAHNYERAASPLTARHQATGGTPRR